MTRCYDWVFLDAGETLFEVAAETGFGRVLSEVGYDIEPARLAVLVRGAREEALVLDHYLPGPAYAIAPDRAHARRQRLVDAIMSRAGVHADDLERCRAAIWESFVEPTFFALYPEVRSTLQRLVDDDLRLGIISNWEPRLELLCRNHDLSRYFAFILASEEVGFAKPGPRIFERAIELAGIEPGRAVHVGDSLQDDIRGAAALGIQAILLDRGGCYPRGTWQPTIGSLSDLPELVGRH